MTTETIQQTKSFGKMSALGKQAEKKYQEFFDAHNPKGWILHDVSGIRAYQNIDVDFVCQKNKDIPFEFERVFTDGGKNFVMIEVKYDGSAERTDRPTGNLPFEIYNKGDWGWSAKTRADFAFVFTVDADYDAMEITKWHNMHRVNMKKWRDRIFSASGSGIVFTPTKPRVEREGKWFVDHLDKIDILKETGIIEKTWSVDW